MLTVPQPATGKGGVCRLWWSISEICTVLELSSMHGPEPYGDYAMYIYIPVYAVWLRLADLLKTPGMLACTGRASPGLTMELVVDVVDARTWGPTRFQKLFGLI